MKPAYLKGEDVYRIYLFIDDMDNEDKFTINDLNALGL